MNGVLNINLVSIVILQQVICKVTTKFETQKVILQRNEVHVDLRYFIFLEKVVLDQLLITFNCSPGYKQNMDVLPAILPVSHLIGYQLHRFNCWLHNEHHSVMLWLEDSLWSKRTSLLDLVVLCKTSDDE